MYNEVTSSQTKTSLAIVVEITVGDHHVNGETLNKTSSPDCVIVRLPLAERNLLKFSIVHVLSLYVDIPVQTLFHTLTSQYHVRLAFVK